jgi:hypothetical protein
MRSRLARKAVIGLMLAAAGTLFVSGNLTCASFFADSAQSSVDFCFLFDCQNGAIGGLIDPCANNYQVFLDCPQLNPGNP